MMYIKKNYFQIVLPGLTDDFICEGEVELSFLRFYQIPVCGNEYCIQSHPLQLREDTVPDEEEEESEQPI